MLDSLLSCLSFIPMEGMEMRFMQQAFLALLLLSPMTATLGLQVIHYKMSFFSDAVGHSAFTGVAIGLLLGLHPHFSMPFFGLCVGLFTMFLLRFSTLSSDTVVGVVFSTIVAFGLAAVSLFHNIARDIQQFLYGDILILSEQDLYYLLILFVFFILFQLFCFNKLLYSGFSRTIATVHKVKVPVYEYIFAAFLSLVVMFAVWSVGVLLVTAMLIIPAATARNISRSSCSMFWLSMAISCFSSLFGFCLSVQPWFGTATGATIVLANCFCFFVSLFVLRIRQIHR